MGIIQLWFLQNKLKTKFKNPKKNPQITSNRASRPDQCPKGGEDLWDFVCGSWRFFIWIIPLIVSIPIANVESSNNLDGGKSWEIVLRQTWLTTSYKQESVTLTGSLVGSSPEQKGTISSWASGPDPRERLQVCIWSVRNQWKKGMRLNNCCDSSYTATFCLNSLQSIIQAVYSLQDLLIACLQPMDSLLESAMVGL